jgi:hypothetical protein
MPHTLTLTWHGPFNAVDTTPYNIGGVPAPWINLVEWQMGGAPLGGTSGVYVIEDTALGTAVYAGRAMSVLNRFGGRNAALHDYHVTALLALPTTRVWWASVASAPGWLTRVAQCERWLVRYLYRRDNLLAAPHLQNRTLLGSYPSPGGLTVQWHQANLPGPAYMDDIAVPGYMAPPPAPGWVGYAHPPGSVVLP